MKPRHIPKPAPKPTALRTGRRVGKRVVTHGHEITLPNENRVAVLLESDGRYLLRFVAQEARKEITTKLHLSQMAAKALLQLLIQQVQLPARRAGRGK